MNKAFNKLGSIELDGNTMRYRISIQELGVDNSSDIEKEIKRKISEMQNDSLYILPFQIEVINRYMVFYYDLNHFISIDYLREIPLLEKIPYYLSLIKLAENHEKGTVISWDRLNFLTDRYEQKLKVFLFETESIRIYEKPDNLLKTVQDLIASTMTRLNVLVGLPKRHDFIDASDENLRFVENIYKMSSLDDLFMYLETVELDLETTTVSNTDKVVIEKAPKQNKLFGKNKAVDSSPTKVVQKTKKKNYKKTKKQANKRTNTGQLVLMFAVPAVLVLYFISNFLLSNQSTNEPLIPVDQPYEETFKSVEHSDKIVNELLEVYRLAYNSDYTKALEILETLNKKDLSEMDVTLLIEVYYKKNQLGTLLDTLPNIANDTVTYMYTKNKLSELQEATKNMKTENPYIKFEVAHLENNFETVLQYADKVEINGRKETQIMDAYLGLGKYEEAVEFAEERGNPDLLKRIEDIRN